MWPAVVGIEPAQVDVVLARVGGLRARPIEQRAFRWGRQVLVAVDVEPVQGQDVLTAEPEALHHHELEVEQPRHEGEEDDRSQLQDVDPLGVPEIQHGEEPDESDHEREDQQGRTTGIQRGEPVVLPEPDGRHEEDDHGEQEQTGAVVAARRTEPEPRDDEDHHAGSDEDRDSTHPSGHLLLDLLRRRHPGSHVPPLRVPATRLMTVPRGRARIPRHPPSCGENGPAESTVRHMPRCTGCPNA